jgi:mannan polymerase II complex MNN10 subunit
MLARSMRKVPSSLVLILVLLAFLVWRVSQDSSYVALSPSSVPVEAEIKSPRVAIMTFVTEQRSYLYLSLKNRDRKLHQKLLARYG